MRWQRRWAICSDCHRPYRRFVGNRGRCRPCAWIRRVIGYEPHSRRHQHYDRLGRPYSAISEFSRFSVGSGPIQPAIGSYLHPDPHTPDDDADLLREVDPFDEDLIRSAQRLNASQRRELVRKMPHMVDVFGDIFPARHFI